MVEIISRIPNIFKTIKKFKYSYILFLSVLLEFTMKITVIFYFLSQGATDTVIVDTSADSRCFYM